MQNIPNLNDIEKSIGGRKKGVKKLRLTFYISEKESSKLKNLALSRDIAVSELVRHLIKKEIS